MECMECIYLLPGSTTINVSEKIQLLLSALSFQWVEMENIIDANR